MSIYVGNLSYEVTQEDLNGVFAEYGSVKRVQLPTDRETGRVRGFGFVEMGTEAEETAGGRGHPGGSGVVLLLRDLGPDRPGESRGAVEPGGTVLRRSGGAHGHRRAQRRRGSAAGGHR